MIRYFWLALLTVSSFIAICPATAVEDTTWGQVKTEISSATVDDAEEAVGKAAALQKEQYRPHRIAQTWERFQVFFWIPMVLPVDKIVVGSDHPMYSFEYSPVEYRARGWRLFATGRMRQPAQIEVVLAIPRRQAVEVWGRDTSAVLRKMYLIPTDWPWIPGPWPERLQQTGE